MKQGRGLWEIRPMGRRGRGLAEKRGGANGMIGGAELAVPGREILSPMRSAKFFGNLGRLCLLPKSSKPLPSFFSEVTRGSTHD